MTRLTPQWDVRRKHQVKTQTEPQIAAKLGRPPLPKHLFRVYVPIRLPLWIAQWIDTQPESRAVVVEKALFQAYKLKAPTRSPAMAVTTTKVTELAMKATEPVVTAALESVIEPVPASVADRRVP